MKDMSIVEQIYGGNLSAITTYQAGVQQASMHRLLQKHCDAILKPYGISKMHWLIIGTVLDSGTRGIRMTDLTDILDTTMSYITNAVNLLESKGMLTRKDNDDDSRSKLVSINPAFAPKCAEIEITLRKGLRKSIYSQIDPAEFRIYMKVMYQLANFEKLNLKNDSHHKDNPRHNTTNAGKNY